jgi:hypothetical protein
MSCFPDTRRDAEAGFKLPVRRLALDSKKRLGRGSMSALAFHEKAGRSQELLWLSKFISGVFLCPDIG